MKKEYNQSAALNPEAEEQMKPEAEENMESEDPMAEEAEGSEGAIDQAVTEEVDGVMTNKKEEPMSKADQAYLSGLMKILHSKETAPQVDAMLQSAAPEKSIPQVALLVNDQMEQAVTQKSGKPSLDTLLKAGVYLVSDLIQIGNTGGFFKVETEQQTRLILETTLKQYITKGLEDGSIDPVELQAKVEPLMTEDQRATGLRAAKLTGTKLEPDESTVLEAYGAKRERKGMLKGGKK